MLPSGVVPVAGVGRVTIDPAGNISGTQYSSAGGKIGQDAIKATIKVNPDCTGTLNVGIYDQESGKLQRTAIWSVVFVDNAREFRAIMTSLVLPDGTRPPVIITMNERRL